MVIKVLGQVIVLGTKIIVGSIRETFRQAVANAARNTAQTVPKTPSTMPLDEAYKILNVTKEVKPADMQEIFEKMFKANDRQAGGSFYLQSKIVRARERIEIERGGI